MIGIAIVRGLTIVIGISSTAVPLYFFYLIANTLAGKETIVSFGLAVGLSATIVVGGPLVALILCHTKGKQQKKELVRLRSRTQELEARLGIGSGSDDSANNLRENQ